MKHQYLILFFVLCAQPASAQQTGEVHGNISCKNVDLTAVDIYLDNPPKLVFADSSGKFLLQEVPFGRHSLLLRFNGETVDSIRFVMQQSSLNLGEIELHLSEQVQALPADDLVQTGSDIAPDDQNESGLADQNVSALLQATDNRETFQSTANFVWGNYGFRSRAYDRSRSSVRINGVLMNDIFSGAADWSIWSGLNDVMRNSSSRYGLMPAPEGINGPAGGISFDMGADAQQAQTKLSLASANRNYRQRIMFTHNSGLQHNGFAYSASVSARLADKAYYPGTYFSSVSAFASVSKTVGRSGQLSLTLLAAWVDRSSAGAATDEVFKLANDLHYNSAWGLQNGKIRTGRSLQTCTPTGILTYTKQIGAKAEWVSTLMAFTGTRTAGGLDWYNALDPRPDYYRNLPSYYEAEQPAVAQILRDKIGANANLLQIDWQHLYDANTHNFETLHNAQGRAGNDFSGNCSLYVLGADVTQTQRVSAATRVVHKVNDVLSYSAGFQADIQHGTYYKQLQDLLGGDYFLNYNQFAAQSANSGNSLAQQDLQAPDRAVLQHEKYKYHYRINAKTVAAFVQPEWNFRRWNVHVSASAGLNTLNRVGLYQNGIFPEESFGKSKTLTAPQYCAGLALQYKINGRNYLLLNGRVESRLPGADNLFVAPRNRNMLVNGAGPMQIFSAEGGWIMRAPAMDIRLVGFATDFKNVTSVRRFYNDDPAFQSFVNMVLQGADTRNIGAEFAVRKQLNLLWELSAAASLTQCFYTANPKVSIYNDNDTSRAEQATEVHIKNYFAGGGPQQAVSLGIAYNSKARWFLKLNGSILSENYVSINPLRRRAEAAESLQASDPLFRKIFEQERLPNIFAADLSGGYSWRLRRNRGEEKKYLSFFAHFGISNLLNNTSIKIFGYEQLRYDFSANNPDKFPTKYMYAPGRNYFAGLNIKW